MPVAVASSFDGARLGWRGQPPPAAAVARRGRGCPAAWAPTHPSPGQTRGVRRGGGHPPPRVAAALVSEGAPVVAAADATDVAAAASAGTGDVAVLPLPPPPRTTSARPPPLRLARPHTTQRRRRGSRRHGGGRRRTKQTVLGHPPRGHHYPPGGAGVREGRSPADGAATAAADAASTPTARDARAFRHHGAMIAHPGQSECTGKGRDHSFCYGSSSARAKGGKQLLSGRDTDTCYSASTEMDRGSVTALQRMRGARATRSCPAPEGSTHVPVTHTRRRSSPNRAGRYPSRGCNGAARARAPIEHEYGPRKREAHREWLNHRLESPSEPLNRQSPSRWRCLQDFFWDAQHRGAMVPSPFGHNIWLWPRPCLSEQFRSQLINSAPSSRSKVVHRDIL